ncbi:MAG: DsbA family oxidoreductase [Cytophagaceae bacterium]
MTKTKIKVDIVSDVVCPWCYIGKRRLEKALDNLKDEYEFELHYKPFELNPNVPEAGYAQKEYLTKKFGSESGYQELTDNVTRVAAEEGLKFDYSKQSTSPNTLNLHRVIWLAGKENKQLQTVEAFFKAYFEEGTDLSKKENILKVAAKAGLDEKRIKALLESEEGKEEVIAEQTRNRQLGVSGVPFYIINDKYGVSGAQPTSLFMQAFKDIGKEISTDGEACDVDGGNC